MRPGVRPSVAAVAALALGGSLLLAPGSAGAGEGPLEEAALAAERLPFAALVSVEWSDRRGAHAIRVDMSAVGRSVRIHGPAEVLAGGRGRPLAGEGWLLSWRGPDAAGATPAIGRKYDIVRAPGPVVAGRPTHLLLLRAGGVLRERMAVDEATRLVLRREVMGPAGRPARVVTVERLEMGARPSPRPPASQLDRPRRLRAGAVAPPYRAPAALAGGYERVGSYQRPGMVQHLYSDGLRWLSLFLRPGALSDRVLPPGGEPIRVARAPGVRYVWAGGEVVTWEAGPVVRTLVGEAPFDEVLAAARSLPEPSPFSVLDRLRISCRRMAEAVSGGR